jgi:TolA-binding protein
MEAVLKLADVEAANGNLTDAIETYQSFLDKFITIMHPYHPEICRTQLRLGESYLELGEQDIAREYLQQALASYSESQYPESPLLARAQELVAVLPQAPANGASGNSVTY